MEHQEPQAGKDNVPVNVRCEVAPLVRLHMESIVMCS